MTISFLPGVEKDIDDVVQFYEKQQSGLGVDLVAEIQKALHAILENPRAWSIFVKNYRRYRLNRFPYGLLYQIDRERDVVIVAVFGHLARRQSFWRRRI